MKKTSITNKTPCSDVIEEMERINKKLNQEVEEHKEAIEELKKSEERFKMLFEGAPDGYYVTDFKGNIVDGNTTMESMLGYKRAELVGGNVFKLNMIPAAQYGRALALLARNVVGLATGPAEFSIRTKNGRFIDVEIRGIPMKMQGKSLVLGIARDITQRKEMEKEKDVLRMKLVRSDKMAGIGTLAAGVAHEFNNLLTIIRSHSEIATMTEDKEKLLEYLKTIIDTSDRATEIVNNLLLFSRYGKAGRVPSNIVDILETVLSLVGYQLRENSIKVIKNYKGTNIVEINKAEIQQVFLNMITNARDAMIPGGGELEISVKSIKGFVEIRFRDTGEGISADTQKKIFEPFYTTKGPIGGNHIPGTGLGLSISYGIITSHNGDIKIESKKNCGTEVIIKLPRK